MAGGEEPALAARVRDLLAPVEVQLDHAWGLDHGTWSVLVKMFPAADIPVIQLSIDATQPHAFQHALGRRLAALRDDGILLMGTGNVVHNLRAMSWNGTAHGWAERFNDRVRDCLLRGDTEGLTDFAQWGDDARLSVPTPEHFLPLLTIAGTKHDDEAISIAVDGIEAGPARWPGHAASTTGVGAGRPALSFPDPTLDPDRRALARPETRRAGLSSPQGGRASILRRTLDR